MATYKTPGVYVEEISTLPASVAQVATAIPAFIGVTEDATKNGVSVKGKPTRISSLVEYKEIFGGGPSLNVTNVTLDSSNNFSEATISSNKILYDSLRMYFQNGGGACYIVAIKYYSEATPSRSEYEGGIDSLKKYDEPTLILFPDASTLLSSGDLYTLQDYSLAHCNTMQDRFTIMDVLSPDGSDVNTDQNNFRNGIGMSYLKYGAAYYPWLECNLDLDVRYRDIAGVLTKSGASVTAADLSSDATAQGNANRLDAVIADNDQIASDIATLVSAPEESIREEFEGLYTSLTTTTSTTKRGHLVSIFDLFFGLLNFVDNWIDDDTAAPNVITDAGGASYFLESSQAYATANVLPLLQQVVGMEKEAAADVTGWAYVPPAGYGSSEFSGTEATVATSGFFDGGVVPIAEQIDDAEPELLVLFEKILGAVQGLQAIGTTLEDNLEETVLDQIPAVRNALAGAKAELLTLPPSGAVAGVYARVDRDRGVWKAPANVSIAAVSDLSQAITFEEQADLNVDTTGGKSINAIRAFTGKGILIWGARTLAGNDNEWRYVPVRRLYIMVEESIKKATEFVVFEPNDKNTWVRVKGMISNFLTELWKQGALAGGKPAQAFFVNVGLGETMTPQDILEGRMIVEIGLAAVRPAEFIILRFSHKLQEA